MRRANIIRRFSPIGARVLISRNRSVRSRAVQLFTIPRHRLNTPLALIVLSVTGVLGGCSHESKMPSQPPRAVRLATVAPSQTGAETLRYSASILPYAQVDLMFRSSGYVTNVSQVRGADGRTRNIGTGDYVEQGLTRVRVGQELTIQTEHDAAPVKGRVTSISPAADIRNRIFAVEVTVNNRDRHLKPGMIASIGLGEVPHSFISIPLSAIVPFPSEPDHFAVMVAQERASTLVANLRKVRLGTTHDNSIAVQGVH